VAALADPATFSSNLPLAQSPIQEANARSVVYSDDPVHLELRQLINRALTPRAVLELQPKIEEHVRTVFSRIRADEQFDVLEAGTYVSHHTFADMMGLPFEQHDRIKAWATSAGMFVRPGARPSGVAAAPDDADEARRLFAPGFEDMKAHFTKLVQAHTGRDQKTLKEEFGLPPFPRAVIAAYDADPKNLDEILTKILPPMHAGGTSTITHIFPNVVDVLMKSRQAWERLESDPSLLDPNKPSEALEELVRLRPVVQGLRRFTTRDVEVRGTLIPAGTKVDLYYISGSHDADEFPEPDVYKDRGLSRHLTFGAGTHSCMGQSLVRLQLKLFLKELLVRFSRVELQAQLQWGGLGVYYTPSNMPVVGRERVAVG
jgi:cytochrome P450